MAQLEKTNNHVEASERRGGRERMKKKSILKHTHSQQKSECSSQPIKLQSTTGTARKKKSSEKRRRCLLFLIHFNLIIHSSSFFSFLRPHARLAISSLSSFDRDVTSLCDDLRGSPLPYHSDIHIVGQICVWWASMGHEKSEVNKITFNTHNILLLLCARDSLHNNNNVWNIIEID